MLRPKDLCQGSGTRTFLEAMQSGKVHLARFVLDALDGRILNGRSESGRTLLMHAVCLPDPCARPKFTQLLLEKGAEVNVSDRDARTALSLACQHGHLDSVKLLVQFNADPELADTWGNSPLMYAACGGHAQVLEFLVWAFRKLGVDLDRTNHAGHSVADFLGQRPGGVEDLRWPSRLPGHVLERFGQRMQGGREDPLPALFQSQLRVESGVRIRFPEAASDAQDSLFASKQKQNAVLREPEGGGGVRTLHPGRKQSYQGEVREPDRGAGRFKRASLQDEKSLALQQPRPRRLRLLPARQEQDPERIRPPPSGIGGLGTRLLRRFTAPEFLKHLREFPGEAGQGRGRMSRSETFPLSQTHQRVNSQPSVDSISAVRCEFEAAHS